MSSGADLTFSTGRFLANGLEGRARPLMKGMVAVLLIEVLWLLEELEREDMRGGWSMLEAGYSTLSVER